LGWGDDAPDDLVEADLSSAPSACFAGTSPWEGEDSGLTDGGG